MDSLPYSQACENNKTFILAILREALADAREVLEVGSGTGQHACYFAGQLPWLRWQPTDIEENLPVLRPRSAAYAGENLLPPVALDVREQPWRVPVPDAVFTANSLHIMSLDSVERLFSALGAQAPARCRLAVYGPFNYGGRYTSDSNARFDQWLAQQNPESAIRDFETVDEMARDAGFSLQSDNEMPANNRLLVWQK
jgi:hypothetical protein